MRRHLKQVPDDAPAENLLGMVRSEYRVGAVRSGHPREDRALIPPVGHIAGRRRVSCEADWGELSHNMTSRPASGNGSGRSRTECTTVNMAVLAPMPSPSARTAKTVTPGVRRSERTA